MSIGIFERLCYAHCLVLEQMVGKKFNDWVLVIFVEVQGGHWVICLGYIFFFSMGTYFKPYVQFFKKETSWSKLNTTLAFR